MKLTIISIKEKEIHTIAWIEAHTIDGTFVIQPGFIPTIFLLAAKKEFTYCLKTGKHKVIMLEKEAFLQVNREEAMLFLIN